MGWMFSMMFARPGSLALENWRAFVDSASGSALVGLLFIGLLMLGAFWMSGRWLRVRTHDQVFVVHRAWWWVLLVGLAVHGIWAAGLVISQYSRLKSNLGIPWTSVVLWTLFVTACLWLGYWFLSMVTPAHRLLPWQHKMRYAVPGKAHFFKFL